VNIPSDTPLVPFNFSAIGTSAHELFHQWNMKYVFPKSPSGAYLLSEGFTNYFAVASLVRAKMIPERSFARFMSIYRNKLKKNPKYKDSTYSKIQTGFATNDDELVDLAYTKGPFVAILMDIALKEDTEGKSSITSWFQTLSKEFGGKRGYTIKDLRRLTIEVSGRTNGKAVRMFDSAFIGGKRLPLGALFVRLGISCKTLKSCTLKPLSQKDEKIRSRLFSAEL